MRIRFFTVALAGLLAVSGCKKESASDQTGPIKIGHFAAITGQQASFGTSCDEGIRLAMEEINAKGGVLGRQIDVITQDDRSVPSEAVTAVEQLINREHVVALLGEVASSNSLAAAPVAQREKIPMLTPASTNPKVTQIGDYIFRGCFTDEFQAGVMAKFAMEDLHVKRVAVLYDATSDYSKGLHDFFRRDIEKAGGTIVSDQSYAQTDQDFRPQLSTIRAQHPDAIYVPGYYTQVGAICKQARNQNITVPLLGGDGWDSAETVKIGGDAVNGCYFTNHYSPDEDRPQVKAFVTDYRKKYDKIPDAMAILGYDAMRLMADAIQRAGSTDPAKIRDALATTKNFEAASGTITMDTNRNAQKPIVIIEFVNGKQKFIKSITPE